MCPLIEPTNLVFSAIAYCSYVFVNRKLVVCWIGFKKMLPCRFFVGFPPPWTWIYLQRILWCCYQERKQEQLQLLLLLPFTNLGQRLVPHVHTFFLCIFCNNSLSYHEPAVTLYCCCDLSFRLKKTYLIFLLCAMKMCWINVCWIYVLAFFSNVMKIYLGLAKIRLRITWRTLIQCYLGHTEARASGAGRFGALEMRPA